MTRPPAAPLSLGQEALWLLDQLPPGGVAYNLATGARLVGLLDHSALERALGTVVHRHEVLRCRIELIDDRPVQRVIPGFRLRLPVDDITGLPEEEREVTARRIAAAEVARPFDLHAGPPLRVRLVRLDGRRHLFVVVMHHIATDGSSMGVFWDELSELYAAYSAARDCTLPDLRVGYGDFAAWQRERLAAGEFDEALAYWRLTLAGAPPSVDLPTDRPVPATRSFPAAGHRFSVDADVVDRLTRLCATEGASRFMGLLAAFAVVLGRYADRDDLVIGTPSTGRNRPELEGLIGLLVNTLPLRVDLSGAPTFRDLVRRVRGVALGALTHQEVPFERLVSELAPVRGAQRHPLVQVMAVLHPAPLGLPRLPGLAAEPLVLRPPTAKFDLSLLMTDAGPGLDAVLEYDAELFDPETVEAVAGRLRRVLLAVVAEPDRPVHAIDLLDAAERDLVTRGFNATAVPPGAGRCLPETVADRARAAPGAVAVRHRERELTYGELDRRANRLAHRIRSYGAGHGAVVGVCVRRSPEFVVAFLAVLKAGAIYLPLDPALPAQRLGWMLTDSRAALVVGDDQSMHDLSPPAGCALIRVDHDPADGPESAPDVRIRADDVAYVIYTSGSTGTPKGVALPHRGLVNLIEAQTRVFAVTPRDRVLQFASPGFDASIFEIVLALGAGAALCLIDADQTVPGPDLVDALRRYQITHATLPPSVLALLPEDGLPSLHTLTVAGEPCRAALVRRWSPGRRMFNLYGPTEATIWTTFAICEPDPRPGAADPPIGRPIVNTTVYVVDRHLRPVPVGTRGELLIGGPGVAVGYLNRPDLTAERFVPDGVGPGSGGRLYRTGDLVRWRRDGSLVYEGRLDRQIKVRGFRVEPGEIENVLIGHPGIRHAHVAAWSYPAGTGGQTGAENIDHRLVGYLVPDAAGDVPEPGALRGYLRVRLPDHLVPTRFVVVPRLPLTPNGKVDEVALRRLDESAAEPEPAVDPRTATERVVAEIWADLLQVGSIGVTDDFFTLGGDSLLAARAVARTGAAFGLEIPLRYLFDAPTVAGLSSRLDEAADRRPVDPAPAPGVTPPDTPHPLSSGQQGLWFLDRSAPGSAAYHVPVALRLTGPLVVPALAAALADVVARHEPLRSRIGWAGTTPVAVPDPDTTVTLGTTDVSTVPAADRAGAVEAILAAEAARPFDLEAEQPVRALLIRVDHDKQVLAVVMHHIATDGWSMRVFWDELSERYEAHRDGRPAAPATLPMRYGDFATAQRDWLAGPDGAAQLAYWTRALAGAPTVIELPADHPRPATRSARGARHPFDLPPDLIRELRALGAQYGTTMFMVLLAAFNVLLWRYSRTDDIVVGAPAANRSRPGTAGLIGYFVNTLVLRTDLSGTPSFREILGRVRDTAIDAYQHQDLPFDRLVAALAPDRSVGQNPLFQVLFAVHQAAPAVPRFAGVSVTPLTVPRGSTKFDLGLFVQPGPTADGPWLATLEYSTDLFEPATVAGLADHFHRLLARIVAAPHQPITELGGLDATERRQLAAWNPAGVEPARERVPEQFAAVVDRAPDRIALVFEAVRLSYGELDRRTNQLANELRAHGAGRGSVVGVCLERGVDLVVCLLAVLKAGAAFVPIDPALPAPAIDHLVADTGALVVLTHRGLAPDLTGRDTRAIEVDTDRARIAGRSPARPAPPGTGDGLAYVMYTSGSTGRPKGVAVTHRSLSHLMFALREHPGFRAEDVVFSVTSFTFDVFNAELFGALTAGATFVLASDDVVLDGRAMAEHIDRYGVTLMQATPGVWRILIDAGWSGRRGLRAVSTGEALRSSLVPLLAERADEVWNLYGPTETTVYATRQRLVAPFGNVVPIGRPIGNTTAYVVDRELRMVPVGALGELLVGGPGVAAGYLNQPELTAERFIPDHFRPESPDRLYRTGDLVRWRADGTLTYHGRLDRQLKVRGYRIEPGEVEVALARHPAVRHAHVTVRDAGPEASGQLTAFLVPADPATVPTAGELRRFLAERLAQQLIPARFVVVTELPLTPNGKVDDGALRRCGATVPESGRAVPPRTPVERELARLWMDVLGVNEVDVHADFFAEGGDSLRAVSLLGRVREATGIDLPVRGFMRSSTLAGLVEQLVRHALETLPVADADRLLNQIEHAPDGGDDAGDPRADPLTGH